MTQNPYAQFGQPGGGEFLEPLESRTSVMAILALIAGVLCLPGAGIVALILGGAAVLLISQSGGRLRGMGLAITGIVLGLLFTIIWIMIFMGIASANQFFVQKFFTPVATTVKGMETGDHAKARTLFTPAADAAITDAQIDAFGARLKADWGGINGSPKNLIDMVQDYMEVGQRMQAMQGRGDVFPAPIRFDKGVTVIAMQFDPAARHSSKPGPGVSVELPVINLGFIAKDGSMVWLLPESESVQLRTGRVPAAGLPGSKAADPDEEKDDEEAASPEAPSSPAPPAAPGTTPPEPPKGKNKRPR